MKSLSIAKKDLKILLKDPGAIIVLFLMPIMFISVMSFALSSLYTDGSNRTISFVVVDLDKTSASIRVIDALMEIDGFQVVLKEGGDDRLLEAAKKEAADGRYPLAVVVPRGFEQQVTAGYRMDLLSYYDPAQTESAIAVGQVVEGVARQVTAEYAVAVRMDEQIKVIQKSIESRISEIEDYYRREIANLDEHAQFVEPPLRADETDYDEIKQSVIAQAKQSIETSLVHVREHPATDIEAGARPDAFTQNVPGYTVMFAFFIVMFAGRSFLQEKRDGTIRRIMAAPVGRLSLYLGKWLPNFIIGIAQVVLLFSFGHFAFGMSLGNSFWGLVVVSLALVWASSTLGMLVSTLFKTESQISGWSVLIVLTLAALGGTMVPLFVMPDVMQRIAQVTPHAWALTGYQDILVRGLGFSDIIPNAIALFGFGFMFLLLSIWRIRL